MTLVNFLSLSGLWLLYFLIHSILASNAAKAAFKQHLPKYFYTYRFLYNIAATVLLLPMAYFIYVIPSDLIFTWTGSLSILSTGISLLAAAGFIYSLRFYGGMDFLGISQLKNKTSDEMGRFVISPLHRFVRHPWYLFALMVIWTRDMNAHFLVSSIMMTGYFFIGSYFEDKKLMLAFGKEFEDYVKKVPGIIPNPRKFLSQKEALNLNAEK